MFEILLSKYYYSINGIDIISIITQVIIEIGALPLAENGVIFRYNHLRKVIVAAASRFVDVPEEEISLINCAKCN